MDFSNKENNQQLADYLREQRQNRHLNLEDVADKIGVPIQHLKNIENGNFDRFDTFYLKMYIKKYATYLSLNVEELYQQFYGSQIQKEVEVKIHKQKVQKRRARCRISMCCFSHCSWSLLRSRCGEKCYA